MFHQLTFAQASKNKSNGNKPLSAKDAPNTSSLPGGLFVKIYHDQPGENIKPGDVIKMNFIQKNGRDSIYTSTYDNGMAQVFPVPLKMYTGDINDVLTHFSEGDSVHFKINLDTMAFYSKQPKPAQYENDNYLSFEVKIEKVFKKNEGEADSIFQQRAQAYFQADYHAVIERLKNGEEAKIDAYLADRKLKMTTTTSGLRYLILNAGNSQRAVDTDTLVLNYTGSLTRKGTNGKYKVFDTNIEQVAKENHVFQDGRPYGPTKMGANAAVPGFSEALKLIGVGGKIQIVIPSKLGYGDAGAPEAGINPFAPIFFEIEITELIKVNPN